MSNTYDIILLGFLKNFKEKNGLVGGIPTEIGNGVTVYRFLNNLPRIHFMLTETISVPYFSITSFAWRCL